MTETVWVERRAEADRAMSRARRRGKRSATLGTACLAFGLDALGAPTDPHGFMRAVALLQLMPLGIVLWADALVCWRRYRRLEKASVHRRLESP